MACPTSANGLGGGGSPLAFASEGCLFAVWQKKTQLVELGKKKTQTKNKIKKRGVFLLAVFFSGLFGFDGLGCFLFPSGAVVVRQTSFNVRLF